MVSLLEAKRFLFSRLSAGNPDAEVHDEAFPAGIEEGIVYRYVGAPTPTMTMDGETLIEEVVFEVYYEKVTDDSADLEEGVQGILSALPPSAVGNTGSGEVFGIRREQPISFQYRLKQSGQNVRRMGWKYRVYPRGSTP